MSVLVAVLVAVLVVLALAVAEQASAMRRRRRVAARGAERVLARAMAAEAEEPGRWAWIIEADARQIEAQAERDGRFGWDSLLVSWRQVADTLPRDVVDAIEGRQRPLGSSYGHVIVHHVNGTTEEWQR